MLRTLRNLTICLTSLLPLQASSPVPADWTQTDTAVEAAVLHVWLAMQLGPEWRHRWQGLQLGISVVCIANNAKLGVRLKF